MKFPIPLFALFLLSACGASLENNTTISAEGKAHITANQHVVNYVNNIALKNPGWDNNDITKKTFIDTLSYKFWHDMIDSNLLGGIEFSVSNISPLDADSHHYLLKLDAYKVVGLASPGTARNDSTEVIFTVSSIISDTLAKNMNNGHLYYIKDYTKKEYSWHIPESIGTSIISFNNPDIHSINTCWLGTYSINLKEIKNILDN